MPCAHAIASARRLCVVADYSGKRCSARVRTLGDSDRDPRPEQVVLDFANGGFAVVQHGSQQGRVGVPIDKGIRQMLGAPSAARGDHGYGDRVGNRAGERDIVTIARAVGIHRCQQDFTGTSAVDFLRPCKGIDSGGHPTAIDMNFPARRRVAGAFGVDGNDNTLGTETFGGFADEVRIAQGGGVDTDLVGAGGENTAEIVDLGDSPADRERDEHLLGDSGGNIEEQSTAFVRCGDIQENQFVSALAIVGGGQFHGIAGIAESEELNPLDHSAIFDIKAGNDTSGQHGSIIGFARRVARTAQSWTMALGWITVTSAMNVRLSDEPFRRVVDSQRFASINWGTVNRGIAIKSLSRTGGVWRPTMERTLAMTQTAYPRFSSRDGAPTQEARLTPAFHARFQAHFIGQQTADEIWPPHSSHPDALRWYCAAQDFLYVSKDPVAAIDAYEKSLDCDPGYLQAWVALGIALVTENSEASLIEADRIFAELSSIPVGPEGVSSEVASIVAQNRAYVGFHRWRHGGDGALLDMAASLYEQAARLSTTPRVEMLCPQAAVLIARGQLSNAEEALRIACGIDSDLVREYVGKYPQLADYLPKSADRKGLEL
jgi:hypothetical protein